MRTSILLSVLMLPAFVFGQGRGVSPADLLKPLENDWTSYNGDYSGKRYSALTQVNKSNVTHLTLAWMTRLNPGPGNPAGGFGRGGRGGGGAAQVIVGGEGTGDF